MGINTRIMDKIVQKTKGKISIRVLITELLKIESEKTAQYKDPYRKLIEFISKESDKDDDSVD